MDGSIPDPTTVHDWPGAVVTVVIILAVVVVPTVLNYLNGKHTRAIKETLTTNNGGSTVKDSLDRVEKGLSVLTGRVAALEQSAHSPQEGAREGGSADQ